MIRSLAHVPDAGDDHYSGRVGPKPWALSDKSSLLGSDAVRLIISVPEPSRPSLAPDRIYAAAQEDEWIQLTRSPAHA